MGKPFYPYDSNDPDLNWLVASFLEERPEFIPVEAENQPLLLLPILPTKSAKLLTHSEQEEKEDLQKLRD